MFISTQNKEPNTASWWHVFLFWIFSYSDHATMMPVGPANLTTMFNGIKATGYCGAYSMGTGPLWKSYFRYREKTHGNGITPQYISHSAVLPLGLHWASSFMESQCQNYLVRYCSFITQSQVLAITPNATAWTGIHSNTASGNMFQSQKHHVQWFNTGGKIRTLDTEINMLYIKLFIILYI